MTFARGRSTFACAVSRLTIGLGLMGVSLPVLAGEARGNPCSSYGEGFAPMQGVDGCFRVGGHIRVDATVMRGRATLDGGASSPAAMLGGAAAQEGRMRLQGPLGGLYHR
ncbi:MAG: porin [Hyphomicrobiales bacterium]|nr:porin [Hyphomicrobiales bacterium]